jgi:hypothetical protein
MQAATPWDGGLAVAGTSAAGDHASVEFWLSADGQDWDSSSPDPEVFGSTDELAIAALTGWRAGLVILAGDVSTSDWDGVVWVGTPAR